jgi:hypothetical protein
MTTRRGFLGRCVGGLIVLGLGGSARADTRERPDLRIDVGHPVFNGQDLRLARFLEASAAHASPTQAALVRAGAGPAEALAWALAPSGAVETRHLEELAGRCGADLLTSDDPAIRHDREEADRRFRDALAVVLPGTELFRLYAKLLGSEALAADVDVLMSPHGPAVVEAVRLLHVFRRFTYHRYLLVRERFHAAAAAGDAVDLVVPAMAPPTRGRGLAAPPTPLRDRVEALAGIVRLCAGRVHPLVPFEPDEPDALGIVRDAVERRGFVGIAVGHEHATLPRALRAWCERDDVPVVMPAARRPETVDAVSRLGLRRGRATRERLERFYARVGMAEPGWMGRLDGAG